MRQPQVQAFLDRVIDHARDAAGRTGLPVSVVLAQWASESGWGTNGCARRNNLGCIMAGDAIRDYPDLPSFVDDYVRVLCLPAYAPVRSLAAGGADPLDVAAALGSSPYDADHYESGCHAPGWLLQAVMRDSDLTAYDKQASA